MPALAGASSPRMAGHARSSHRMCLNGTSGRRGRTVNGSPTSPISGRQGWLYLAVVLDLFSRRVVGWSMKEAMTAQMVTDALMMAIWRRGRPDTLLHHSDQGSQYTSESFQRLMADHGITLLDEPVWQLLGQCGDGELLLLAQDRAHPGESLPNARSGPRRCVRLYRALLQSETSTLDAGISQPDGIRKESHGSLSGCPLNRQQLTLVVGYLEAARRPNGQGRVAIPAALRLADETGSVPRS